MREQLRLPFKSPGRAKVGHGGRRRGAGRPNRSGKQGHSRRPAIDPRHPVHVTVRLRAGLPSLRRKDVFKTLRQAVSVARGAGFGVAHFAILSNHLHLLIEPAGRRALFRAVQSFEISFARRLNRLAGTRGEVFNGRYDLQILDSPSRVRAALAYVLTNESRHRRDPEPRLFVGPFSSAARFTERGRLLGSRFRVFRDTRFGPADVASWLDQILVAPETWLLRVGWLRARGTAAPVSARP
jgi:REP element-mobilizing transposase RayT